MLARLARFVIGNRLWTVLALLVLIGPLLIGMARLRIDFSSKAFFADDDRATTDLQAFQQTWGVDDDTVFVVIRSPVSLLQPGPLRTIAELADELAASPDVATVTDFTELPTLYVGDGGQPTRTLPKLVAEGVAEEALPEVPFVPALLSRDGHQAALAVELSFSSDDLGAVMPLVEELRRVLEPFQGRHDLQFRLAGVPAIRSAFFSLTVRDQQRLVPLTLVVMAALLWLMFRRAHGMVIPVVAAILPTGMLLGAMGWLGEPIGLLNQAYFTLIPVIAVADAIHMVARVHGQVRRTANAGGDTVKARRQAIVTGVSKVGFACLLTTLTTGIGLLSLVATGTPVVARFGAFAALGIAFAYLTVIVVVPLLLSLPANLDHPDHARLGRCIDGMAAWALRRPVAVLVGTALIGALAVVGGFSVVVDSSLTGLLQPDHPVSRTTRRLDRHLGGALAIQFDLEAPEGTFTRPEVLARLYTFEQHARAREPVRAVYSPAGPIAAVHRLLTGTAAIPQQPETVQSHVEQLQAVDTGLPWPVTDQAARARVTVRTIDPGGRAFLALSEDLQRRLRRQLPESVEIRLTGTPHVAYQGINRMGRDLRESLAVAFVVIVVLVGLWFRSPLVAVCSAVPNALPIAVAYGAMGWLNIDLDPLGAVILTLALGIAVDDTVHLLVRIREQLRRGDDAPSAIAAGVRYSGLAVSITTVVLAGGLCINLASSFPPLVLLGGLGAFTLVTALVCDLLVLPALLGLVGRRLTALAGPARSQ